MALQIGKIRKNIPLLRQQVAVLIQSTSNTVKCIWVIVLISYLLSFFDEAVDLISVTPGYFLPPSFRVWTALTFCFLETHFWNVVIDIILIGVCGKVIEPIWGPTEIISFFVVVNVGVALVSSASFLIIYTFTSNPELLFNVHIHGLSGYIAGVTVAVKQVMPDILVMGTPFGRITNKNVPLSVILISFILWLINISPSSTVVMITYGVLISWIYLRFYQKHSSGTKGDLSESFNFASFFPSAVQPPIAVLANTIFSLLVKMKLCRKRAVPSSSSELTSVVVGLKSSVTQDERRKQKALTALTERLNKADRPRVVGTVGPQIQNHRIHTTDEKKLPDASADSLFESTSEKVPLLADEDNTAYNDNLPSTSTSSHMNV